MGFMSRANRSPIFAFRDKSRVVVSRVDKRLLTSALSAALLLNAYLSAQSSNGGEDKYRWLEDAGSKRSLAWVKTENDRSIKIIESDSHFADFEASALRVLESKDRLPLPEFHAGEIYNTWQDTQHVRGILRRTSLVDYLSAHPQWRTILDYDALAKHDKQSWVQKGLICLYPDDQDCLVALSAGGEDAVTLREFDSRAGKFVEHGFVLPRSIQDVGWVDNNTLIVARDWGTDTLTKSGLPYVVKMWKRGEPLQRAKEIFRGRQTDVDVEPRVWRDASNHSLITLDHYIDIFHDEILILTPDGPKRIALPPKATINGLVDGQVIVTVNEDWKPDGHRESFVQGSIVSLALAAVKRDPGHLEPTLIFAPTKQEFAQSADVTKDCVLVTTLENIRGRAYIFTHGRDRVWTREKLPLPDLLTVSIETANKTDNQFFLLAEGFLTPSSLWLGNGGSHILQKKMALPAQFNGSSYIVEQLKAISRDGTEIPYFVVRSKRLKYDGSNPTLMSAYGGFQIAMTPSYAPVLGNLWLDRGGVYVLANIRGGGEFGPAWHNAGLKTQRQRIYDDFAAVGRDLFTRRITSPRRLGIEGGSNGGLLMGVEMTQNPDLWNAVVIEVPLLDMLRYEHLAQGSQWVAEYGSVLVPEERAFLASISPYQQLKHDVKYPEPLIFTTTNDDRVGPIHARKFAAKMEEYGKPFLYEEIVEGGHGDGVDLKQTAKTIAFEYTYLNRKLMN
jgi:prolyl oligopeptidase